MSRSVAQESEMKLERDMPAGVSHVTQSVPEMSMREYGDVNDPGVLWWRRAWLPEQLLIEPYER